MVSIQMNYNCPDSSCSFSQVKLSELEAEDLEKNCPKCKKPLTAKNYNRLVPNFENEIRGDATKMMGREEEIGRLIEAIKNSKSGTVWVAGHGGIGKSFLFAKVYSELQSLAEFDGIASTFYRFRSEDRERCNRQSFTRFICYELNELGVLENDKISVRNSGLNTVLNSLTPPTRVVVFIDGIDEINSRDRNFVSEVILANSHPQVLWVCCGKQSQEIVTSFENAIVPFSDGLPPMSDEDIKKIIFSGVKEVFPGRNHSQKIENYVDLATSRAMGSPLYAKHLIEDLKSGKRTLNDQGTAELPSGVENYHDDLMSRVGSSDLHVMIAQILSSLAVAYEPLAYREILAFLKDRKLIRDHKFSALLDDGLKELSSVLDQAPDPEGEVGYQFFHPSLKEHLLRSPNFEGSIELARSAIAELSLNKSCPPELRNYLFRCGIRHLLDLNFSKEAKVLLLDLDHLIEMNKLGIEWPEISGYWDRLGGEDAAREYLASIQLSEKGELAEEDWEKFDFVCFLAQKAGWKSLALSLTQATLSVLSTILPAQHPRMALGWLNLANRSKENGNKNAHTEYQAMSKWSELRGEGKFVNIVDPDAFEKQVGISYSRAKEIEEELKS